MQTFRYPEDYLSKRGNIVHCWEVHKKRMKKIGKPYADYNSFYNRVKRYNWNLYKAIHTPARLKNMVWYKELWVVLRTLRFRFIYLFKRG